MTNQFNLEKIKAILVDDEESARDVLENLLLRFCPQVELIHKCSNVPEGAEIIKSTKPDLVFLDIEMPVYAGYEIVNFFNEVNFEIIFVTAYDNYAIKAFELAAVDYLLKPIDIDRLKTAVIRVQQKVGMNTQLSQIKLVQETIETKSIKNIFITDKGQQYLVNIEDIIAIEAQESYCHVHTNTKKYLVSKNLKHFETVLENHPLFFRTHKSWIVNRNYIKSYSKSNFDITLSNNQFAKLSKYRKEDFEKWILTEIHS